MTSRTTNDYERMYEAGVRAVVEPAFWLGQPRTSPESFYDYFDSLLGWEPGVTRSGVVGRDIARQDFTPHSVMWRIVGDRHRT